MRAALWLIIASLCLGVSLSGCQQAPPGEPAAKSSAAADPIAEALAGLTESDRTLALAQATCPVGGGKLGSMGTPVKVEVQGRAVFLCCEGCKGELEANSAKYLAQLDEATQKDAASEDAATEGPSAE